MGLFDFLGGLFGGSDDGDDGRRSGSTDAGTDRRDDGGDGDGGGVEGLDDALGRIADADPDSEDGASEIRAAMEEVSAAADQVPDDDEEETPPPGRFREEAEELAEFWSGRGLDFTPASLGALDDLVDEQWEKDRFRNVETSEDGVHMDELVFQGLVEQLGSYFGEVLVRTYDAAEWADHDEFGWVVEVDGPDAELVSNVFHIATDCLREPSKFVASHDTVADSAGVGEPLGDHDSVTIAVEVPDEDASPEEFRAEADRLTADYAWYDLDYTPESLADLDDVVTEEIFDGEVLLDEFEDAELSETVRKLGSYYGEVIARQHDGEWTRADDAWVVAVEGEGGTATVEPFRSALTVLHEGTSFVDRYVGAVGGEAAELAAMFTADAEAFAAEWPGYDLDFTVASLGRLDELVGAEFADLDPETETDDGAAETLTSMGFYFGETLRRADGAAWAVDDDGPTVLFETDGGGHVGVEVVETAATCVLADATFAGTREELLAAR